MLVIYPITVHLMIFNTSWHIRMSMVRTSIFDDKNPGWSQALRGELTSGWHRGVCKAGETAQHGDPWSGLLIQSGAVLNYMMCVSWGDFLHFLNGKMQHLDPFSWRKSRIQASSPFLGFGCGPPIWRNTPIRGAWWSIVTEQRIIR